MNKDPYINSSIFHGSCHLFGVYPSSHNHGSENGPLETKVIFQAPIFHFHDYGRKGNVVEPCCELPFSNTSGGGWLLQIRHSYFSNPKIFQAHPVLFRLPFAQAFIDAFGSSTLVPGQCGNISYEELFFFGGVGVRVSDSCCFFSDFSWKSETSHPEDGSWHGRDWH